MTAAVEVGWPKGRPLSLEHRQKISEGRKRYFERRAAFIAMQEKPMVTPMTVRDLNKSLDLEFLEKFYTLFDVDKEQVCSYRSLAETIGVPLNTVQRVIQRLKKAGYIQVRDTYGAQGRAAHWTIKAPYDDSLEVVKKFHNGLGRTTTTNPKPTEKVERNNIAQAKAWYQAAKAYMKQTDVLNDKLAEIKAAGIEIDEDAFYKAASVKHDEKLACLALMVPYVDYLERKRNK